jgi:hypothetical protein
MAAMTPEQLADCLRVLALHVGGYRLRFGGDPGTGSPRSARDAGLALDSRIRMLLADDGLSRRPYPNS